MGQKYEIQNDADAPRLRQKKGFCLQPEGKRSSNLMLLKVKMVIGLRYSDVA